MKKLTLIALLAVMLIGMLAFAACDTEKAEETVEETVEEVVDTTIAPVVDTLAAQAAEVVPDVAK
ncbi:MAG: hypothetical protein PHG32_02845 [Candidatus Cloacimonetes bacterium]|nr:hypothetical protein [Candidatus Cloacimonadota bacterium]